VEGIEQGQLKYGAIDSIKELQANLEMNAIPFEVMNGNVPSYEDFLEKRRVLMAEKIRRYYASL
jgi:hypothetical protein